MIVFFGFLHLGWVGVAAQTSWRGLKSTCCDVAETRMTAVLLFWCRTCILISRLTVIHPFCDRSTKQASDGFSTHLNFFQVSACHRIGLKGSSRSLLSIKFLYNAPILYPKGGREMFYVTTQVPTIYSNQALQIYNFVLGVWYEIPVNKSCGMCTCIFSMGYLSYFQCIDEPRETAGNRKKK